MSTFNIHHDYSATYTLDRTATGWSAHGMILRGNDTTGISFEGQGPTRETAIDKAIAEAERVCPKSDLPPISDEKWEEFERSLPRNERDNPRKRH